MAEYRRKIFYIDKIFQKKFLFLFLSLNLLASAGNVLYLFLYLKKDVESNMFRSRIVISNINEIIINRVFEFNLVLIVAITLLAIVFYAFVRRRIKYFAKRLKEALYIRQRNNSFNDFDFDLPEEFEEINDVLGDFFGVVDRKLRTQRRAISLLRKFVDCPDDKTKQRVGEELGII